MFCTWTKLIQEQSERSGIYFDNVFTNRTIDMPKQSKSFKLVRIVTHLRQEIQRQEIQKFIQNFDFFFFF